MQVAHQSRVQLFHKSVLVLQSTVDWVYIQAVLLPYLPKNCLSNGTRYHVGKQWNNWQKIYSLQAISSLITGISTLPQRVSKLEVVEFLEEILILL